MSQQREEFAPANALRQMYPGEAVLLHGTLPPIHLDAVRWWKEPHLTRLVPLSDTGDPMPPEGVPTCPMTSAIATDTSGPVDAATLESALAELPEPLKPTAAKRSAPVAKATLADPPAKRPMKGPRVERYSGKCHMCQAQLRPGDGQRDTQDGKPIIRCAPSCTDRKRAAQNKDQP